MLKIESWKMDSKNKPPGFAWNDPSRAELRLNNDAWSKSKIKWSLEPAGKGGELSPGNFRTFKYTQPSEIKIELVNPDSDREAVGSFVSRG